MTRTPPLSHCVCLLGAIASGLVALALVPGAVLAQSCPATVFRLNSGATASSTAPVADTTLGSPGAFDSFRVAWDLRAGSVLMYQCCTMPGASVRAIDAYDLAGVAPGTPIALTAEFVTDGAVFTAGCGGSGCGGVFGAGLRHGGDSTAVLHQVGLFNGRTEFHDVLQLPVTIAAGHPETIQFLLWGQRTPGGSHGAEGRGQVRFAGLPPGVSVVSCKGYGFGPTSVRSTSWGALKIIHR